MKSFFHQGQPGEGNSSWFGETSGILSAKRSDFVPYLDQNWLNVNLGEHMRRKNVKNRMMEMVKDNWNKTVEAGVPRTEKSFRHMLKERLRRKSHTEGYTGLRAILPIGTKCDKISLTTAATEEIIKTQRIVEALGMRNMELNEKLASKGKLIRVRVCNPTSGIDSMAEVLHCLKDLGSDFIRMQAHFSDQEFSAELEIESQIAEEDAKRAVHTTLVEVEKKLLRQKSSRP
ncbi:unnamed protein product [Rhodiola kirilowii]